MKRKKFLNLSATAVLGSYLFQACSISSSRQQKDRLIRGSEKIAFFGDSITFDGRYIEILNDYLKDHDDYKSLSLLNYGKNSETVSGLSEEVHEPPRPLLFDRIEETYAKDEASLLFFCYGINDAIYQPFSNENFKAYKTGVDQFLQFTRLKSCKTILLSAPTFGLDSSTAASHTTKSPQSYSWKEPYSGYDEVMQEYSSYIMSLKDDVILKTIDIYSPLRKEVDKAYDKDPIHPNGYGHQVIAETIIKEVFA